IADARVFVRTKQARVHPEHLGASGGGLQDIHEDLDGGGFARAVRSDQTEDTALGDVDIHAIQHGRAPAEALGKAHCAEDCAHYFLLPTFSVALRRRQCCVMESITSSSSRPSFCASTTSCSNSFLSRLP